MQRSLLAFGLAVLLSGAVAAAQQPKPNSTSNQTASSTPSAQSNQQDQNNPKGGSPNSSIPGRVTGETPTEVQQALDKGLPPGSDVTASVADDGSLKLTGTVKTDADKAKAEQIARQKTNKEINDQIQIKPDSSQTSTSR